MIGADISRGSHQQKFTIMTIFTMVISFTLALSIYCHDDEKQSWSILVHWVISLDHNYQWKSLSNFCCLCPCCFVFKESFFPNLPHSHSCYHDRRCFFFCSSWAHLLLLYGKNTWDSRKGKNINHKNLEKKVIAELKSSTTHRIISPELNRIINCTRSLIVCVCVCVLDRFQ